MCCSVPPQKRSETVPKSHPEYEACPTLGLEWLASEARRKVGALAVGSIVPQPPGTVEEWHKRLGANYVVSVFVPKGERKQ